MLKDIGFWDAKGEYIEDIQEVDMNELDLQEVIIKNYAEEIKRLEQENAELKADLKSLEYTVALQGKRDIDNATDLFVKHIAKIESENSILKAEKAKYYQQTLDDEIQINELLQTLQEIKKIAEALSCKHPEDCWENKPDWNGEVYGCDVADNWKEPSELATCPSKLASAILQIITKAEVGE